MSRLTFRRRACLYTAAVAAALLVGLAALRAQDGASPFGGLSRETGLLLRDDVVVALIQNSSGDLARDTVARLSLWERSQVTEGYAEAAAWIAGRAKEVGLEHVGIEQFPSDGKVTYFGSPTERRWTVRKGELWITAPIRLKVTSYDEMPMSLAGGSTTADVEAELVDVGEGTTDADYAADVKGRVVLASGDARTVVSRAVVQRGAAGVITSWSVPVFDRRNRMPGDFPGQVGWSRIEPAPEGGPGRFAFLVSARRAQEIKSLLKQAAVRVRASVDAALVPGSLDVVSGVIPGLNPAEEVVITAHLDHYKPGANDNASGSGAILEMARAMKGMIDAKALPQPLRTIRFMWVPEYSGTRAWFSTHLDDPVKRVAELNFDMVGENVKSTNAVFAVSYSPDAGPSFLNAVSESITDFINRFNDDRYARRSDLQVISLTGSRDRTYIRMSPYLVGTDHELFNSAGIPGTTLGVFPDDYYHSSGDSIEQVDATQLHRAVVFGLAGLTTLAYAADGQAADLAAQALVYGRQRAAGAESEAARWLLSASKETFAAADRAAGALVPHVYRRERAAILSCSVFATSPAAKRRVERLAALMDQDQPAARKRIEELAALRALELGAARDAPAPAEAEKRAARLVPAWEPGKRLTTIDAAAMGIEKDAPGAVKEAQAALVKALGVMRARGESELRAMGLPNAPATWVDGTRSILDIASAVSVEYAPMTVGEVEAYFRVFEKAGAMRIVEKPAGADAGTPVLPGTAEEQATETVCMERMPWPMIERAVESGFTTVVVAVGSTEQHGLHLPTMTDARFGDDIAERVARKLGRALQARTIDVGLSEHHLAFAGTISLKPETLSLIIRDYVDSLARHGFRRIVFLPTHGGNFAAVRQAIEEARKAHPGIEVTGFTDIAAFGEFLATLSAERGISAAESGGHAGEFETSVMMALEGALVRVDRLEPGFTGQVELKTLLEKGMPAISANGILGDPRKASPQSGRFYLERLAEFLAARVGPAAP